MKLKSIVLAVLLAFTVCTNAYSFDNAKFKKVYVIHPDRNEVEICWGLSLYELYKSMPENLPPGLGLEWLLTDYLILSFGYDHLDCKTVKNKWQVRESKEDAVETLRISRRRSEIPRINDRTEY